MSKWERFLLHAAVAVVIASITCFVVAFSAYGAVMAVDRIGGVIGGWL